MQNGREREDEGTRLSESTIFSRRDLERITRTEGELDGVKRVQGLNLTILRIFGSMVLGVIGIVLTGGFFVYNVSNRELNAMQEQTQLIEQETRELDVKIEEETRKLDVKIDVIGKRMEGVEGNIEKILKVATQQSRVQGGTP